MASVSSTTTSANRLTGLATGLDIDSMVKSEMSAYENKVNSVIQKKDIVEIKQKLYRDILDDTRKFYNKYLDPLSKDSLVMSGSYKNIKFTSSNENVVTVRGNSSAQKENYTVEITELAQKASLKIDAPASDGKLTLGEAEINFEASNDTNKTAKENIEATIKNMKEAIESYKKKDGITEEQLKALNVDIRYSEFDNKIIVEAKEFGQGTLKYGNQKGTDIPAKGTISKNGITKTLEDLNGGKELYSNSITVDGVSFTFNNTTGTNPVFITGKTDVTEIKDKIVNFVNDYNTLIEKLNESVNTKHDRDYVPLTSAQKKEMSDKEIELWEKKVQEGLLYKDSDITRVADSMKEAMRTIMLGTGTSLEKIGITPVKDYSGNKNGTFSIDEAKLESALENNIEDVMKLFTNAAPKEEELLGLTDEQIAQRKNQTGIIYKLKNSLYNQVMISDSVLAKKVGIEGTSTFTSNTLTKNISDYEAKIKKMNSEYSRKEQLLYSKYANLERIMNKYNSQQLYLSSYLGS